MITGCGTALVTPFRADGSLDEQTFRKLVRRQIESGIDFLVPCGTTGESPTLSHEEHLRVVELTIEEASGKTPVVAGAGGYSTSEVIELAKEVKRLGANAILSVTPYYNRPTQEGLYQHYKAIAEAVDIPIVLYSVQGRTAVNIETATVLRLAEIPNIVAIKEASGNVNKIAAIANRIPKDFDLLSGDDALTLPLIALGGRGLISVVSNVIPGEMSELVRLGVQGDMEGCRAIFHRFLPFMEACFIESNPMPVKAAMAELGLLELNFRLPMVPPKPETVQRMREVLKQVGLTQGAPVAS